MGCAAGTARFSLREQTPVKQIDVIPSSSTIIAWQPDEEAEDDNLNSEEEEETVNLEPSTYARRVSTRLTDPIECDEEGRDPEELVKLIIISDPGQDLDDEMSYILLRFLGNQRVLKVLGVVATLAPAFDRARLLRGSLDMLGMFDVPVGVGTDGGDMQSLHKASVFEEYASSYMPTPFSQRAEAMEPARLLMYRLYQEAKPRSITLLIIASLKDAALFLRDNEELFVQKTLEVVIMGGVQPWDSDQAEVVLVPDTAHNQMFDQNASKFFYDRCQQLGVKLVVVSRWCAYAARVPRSCYDDLAGLGSPVGCRLRNAQRASIEQLWARANAPAGSPVREGLPDRCDRVWFLKTFCGDCEAGYTRDGADTIWDLVETFVIYDAVALLAALPRHRQLVFKAMRVKGLKNTIHLVLGINEKQHCVLNPEGVTAFLVDAFRKGLAIDLSPKFQCLWVTQKRWNRSADEMMACAILRTFYDLGVLSCAGIIVTPGPPEEIVCGPDKCTASEALIAATEAQLATEAERNEMEKTLRFLGLGHVPVYDIDNYASDESAEIVNEIYQKVGPAGVFLIVTACAGDVVEFMKKYPNTFRDKTAGLVHVGGSYLAPEMGKNGPTGEHVLRPDPAAQDNKLDMVAAESFYTIAQESLVPLVIISRHFAQAVALPRSLFDALGSSGGVLGEKLKSVQQASMQKLWEAAKADDDSIRRGLPARCDRKWFVKTFLSCEDPEDDNIWPALSSFNVYSSLALLAAIPSVFHKYVDPVVLTVRGVKHRIVGISADQTGVTKTKAVHAIRSLIYQCLFKGTRLNASEFTFVEPPPIELDLVVPGRQEKRVSLMSAAAAEVLEPRPATMWNFDACEEALDWLRQQSDGLRCAFHRDGSLTWYTVPSNRPRSFLP